MFSSIFTKGNKQLLWHSASVENVTRALDKREYLMIIRDIFVNSAEKHRL